ncbi:MAG: hypothetical protein WAN36_12020 [Calditrichia bacterium]
MKKRVNGSLLIILILLLVWGCEDETNKADPPGKVQLIAKTAEDAVQEHGIDAVPEFDAILLEWRPNSGADLSGYKIYRSRSSGQNYVSVAEINKQFGAPDTTWLDKNVQVENTYYYYVRAFDTFDQYGEPSDTVNYTLVEKPVALYPINDIVTDSLPEIRWDNAQTNDFIFRLQKEVAQDTLAYRIISQRSIKYNFPEVWTLAELGISVPLEPGRYFWRIDAVQVGVPKGAESNWVSFRIQ